jgi:hypothetical protein
MDMELHRQATENWKTYAKEFKSDGSLRDVCMLSTDLNDWNEMAKLIVAQGCVIFG